MRTYSSSQLAFHMIQYGKMTVNKSRTHVARVLRPHVQTRARKHGVVVEIDWGRAYSRRIYSTRVRQAHRCARKTARRAEGRRTGVGEDAGHFRAAERAERVET